MAQRLPQSFLVFVLLIGALEGSALFNSCHFSLRPTRSRAGGRGAAAADLEVPVTVLATEEAIATPVIQTDKRNYRRGQTVTVSGSGWQPGETVRLALSDSSTSESDQTSFATADSSGRILHHQISLDTHGPAVAFVLTATGQSSGGRAQTRLTKQPVTNRRAAVPPSDGVATRRNTFFCP